MSATNIDRVVKADHRDGRDRKVQGPDVAAFNDGLWEYEPGWFNSMVTFLRGRGPRDVAIVLGLLALSYCAKTLASGSELGTGAVVGIIAVAVLCALIVALALILDYKTHDKDPTGPDRRQAPDTRHESGDP